MNKKVFAGLAVVGLLLTGSANATFTDSLNDNRYFGVNTWQLLDVVEPGDLPNVDYWSVRGATSRQVSGTAALNPLVWNTYQYLAMVLKGGGAVSGSQMVNWSLYSNTNRYSWIYGVDANGQFRSVYHVSLYGSIRPEGVPTPVSEPTTIVLMLLGLAGIALLTYRRRRAARI